MIRKLRPWFENIKKLQVKSPKLYIRDSGVLHSLLGISSENYRSYPKIGASWEGFALEQLVISLCADPEDCYFWGAPSYGELDLLLVQNGVKKAFEFKYTDNPTITKSMRRAKEILSPSTFTIVTPGKMSYSLGDGFDVMGIG
jgi:uncharacterized protein